MSGSFANERRCRRPHGCCPARSGLLFFIRSLTQSPAMDQYVVREASQPSKYVSRVFLKSERGVFHQLKHSCMGCVLEVVRISVEEDGSWTEAIAIPRENVQKTRLSPHSHLLLERITTILLSYSKVSQGKWLLSAPAASATTTGCVCELFTMPIPGYQLEFSLHSLHWGEGTEWRSLFKWLGKRCWSCFCHLTLFPEMTAHVLSRF